MERTETREATVLYCNECGAEIEKGQKFTTVIGFGDPLHFHGGWANFRGCYRTNRRRNRDRVVVKTLTLRK